MDIEGGEAGAELDEGQPLSQSSPLVRIAIVQPRPGSAQRDLGTVSALDRLGREVTLEVLHDADSCRELAAREILDLVILEERVGEDEAHEVLAATPWRRTAGDRSDDGARRGARPRCLPPGGGGLHRGHPRLHRGASRRGPRADPSLARGAGTGGRGAAYPLAGTPPRGHRQRDPRRPGGARRSGERGHGEPGVLEDLGLLERSSQRPAAGGRPVVGLPGERWGRGGAVWRRRGALGRRPASPA